MIDRIVDAIAYRAQRALESFALRSLSKSIKRHLVSKGAPVITIPRARIHRRTVLDVAGGAMQDALSAVIRPHLTVATRSPDPVRPPRKLHRFEAEKYAPLWLKSRGFDRVVVHRDQMERQLRILAVCAKCGTSYGAAVDEIVIASATYAADPIIIAVDSIRCTRCPKEQP